MRAAPAAPTTALIARTVELPSAVGGETEAGGGEESSADLTTSSVGTDSTVTPGGKSAVAAATELRDGSRLDLTDPAAVLLVEVIVTTRLTDAAVTSRDTRLSATPAALAKRARMSERRAAV